MRFPHVLLTFAVIVGCGNGDDSRSAGATTAGDDCKQVQICDSLPPAHVDSRCGTKSARATPINTAAPTVVNQCQYSDGKDVVFMVGRTCHPGEAGTDRAKQFYRLIHDQKGANVTTADLPGIGDEALYRSPTDHSGSVDIVVRKGNVVTMLEHENVTPATEDTIKTTCLIALYNELAAK